MALPDKKKEKIQLEEEKKQKPSKEIIKETCPHCNNTELYKLNI